MAARWRQGGRRPAGARDEDGREGLALPRLGSALAELGAAVAAGQEVAELWRPWAFMPREEEYLARAAAREGILAEARRCLSTAEPALELPAPLPTSRAAAEGRARCEELLAAAAAGRTAEAPEYRCLAPGLLAGGELFPPQAALEHYTRPADRRLARRLAHPGHMVDRIARTVRLPRDPPVVAEVRQWPRGDAMAGDRYLVEALRRVRVSREEVTLHQTREALLASIDKQLEELAGEEKQVEELVREEEQVEGHTSSDQQLGRGKGQCTYNNLTIIF